MSTHSIRHYLEPFFTRNWDPLFLRIIQAFIFLHALGTTIYTGIMYSRGQLSDIAFIIIGLLWMWCAAAVPCAEQQRTIIGLRGMEIREQV
jgi:hypothetical protein